MFDIYVIQNKINDKVYVGQTINKYRYTQHKYHLNNNIHKNSYLQNAWNKYGIENFEFFILDSYSTREEINEAEIFYIKWYKNLELSYNLSGGGEGGTHSEESKLKMSVVQKGKKHSEETKLKIGISSKNRFCSEETKIKMRLSHLGKRKGVPSPNKGIPMSEEQKEKLRKANLGKKHTEETRQKISESHLTESYREKISKKIMPKMSEEHKQKLISIHKGKPLSDEHKKKLSSLRKGKPWSQSRRDAQTPDVTKKISEAAKCRVPWNKGISKLDNTIEKEKEI